MKTLFLDRDYKLQAAKLVGQFPDRSHATLALDADTKLITPDGSITAVLLCNVIPTQLHKRAYELWKPVNDRVDNRPMAVGTLSLPRPNKKDSALSRRSGVHACVVDVIEARQDTLGYSGQTCRKTPLTIRHPEMSFGNKRLVTLVDQLYARYLPTFYAEQRTAVERNPRCRLWNTAFTTIYIAKNFRTAYHTDAANLTGVMSVLMPMGDFVGGELVFPRWRFAVGFKAGDLLLFDPQQLHGNLPFEGERLSAIFFCARRIIVEAKTNHGLVDGQEECHLRRVHR